MLGLGAIGSACVYQLAKRGASVLGLEQFDIAHLPSANGSVLAFKICMYTHGGPWLGPLPGQKRVTFIAACNGGGFKFSSAYGEALADLATEGTTELPVGFMALG